MGNTSGGESGEIRAIALFSGGLDSALAACLLRDQGIGIQAIAFETPFFDGEKAERAAAALGVPFRRIEFTQQIVSILKGPRYGFGSCLNPCIDCHATMIRRAGELMPEFGCRFICTGEVLNQRPFSQTRPSLEAVAKMSGFAGWIVRPLSAGLLAETEPEKRGWVDRGRLLRISGRSRKEQHAMAGRYGLGAFTASGGGCRLTEPNFTARLRDLMAHEGIDDPGLLHRLRIGRHFRIGPAVKLIVGRNRDDNAVLASMAGERDLVLRPEGVQGPLGLLPAAAGPADVETAAAICARYSDAPAGAEVCIALSGAAASRRIRVRGAAPADADRMMIALGP